MKIWESLKAVPDCNDADLEAILAVLESDEYGYERDGVAAGSFEDVDAAQLDLNEKRKNILRTAVQAAPGQGMAAATNCTRNYLLFAPCMNHLQPLIAAANSLLSRQLCFVAAAFYIRKGQ